MSEMKGFTTKDELPRDDTEFLGKLVAWHDVAKKARRPSDWNWYLYDNYYRGNHYIQYNRQTHKLVNPPRPKGQVRLTVNLIFSIVRGIRNFATSYRPRWSVSADSTVEDEINNAAKSADVLDYYYDVLYMPRKIKGIANYIIKYGLGYFQYAWDEQAVSQSGQMGECDVWVLDPFDVYLDPWGQQTGDIQNCRFIDVAKSKPIQDIINNPNYKSISADNVSSDTRKAASEFKDILLKSMFADDGTADKELTTVILHETLYKKQIKVKNKVTDEKGEEVEKDDVETQVWIASWIDGHLLRNEQTEFSKYNLIAIASDDNPNEVAGEGYIKNLIPLNKVLNRLESQVVEYNNLVNRGRLIADKEAGISRITNETGEIIEKNQGFEVREWQPGGLSSDLDRQINRLRDYIRDISGVNDAFNGDAPPGVKSGVAIESLKAQTANNLQDMKDNLEAGLAELGECILELVANKVIAERQMQITKKGKPHAFKIKGQVGIDPDSEIGEDTYVIGSQNRVSVNIGSDLAFTREGRVQRLDKMLEQGIIGPEDYLDGIEFGDVDGVVKRAKQHQFDQKMMEKVASTVPPMPGMDGTPMKGMGADMGGQGMGGGMEGGDSWLKLADDENMAMLDGEVIPPTKGAPKEHTAIHIAWGQSDEVVGNDELAAVLLEHIQGEEAQQGLTPPAT